MPNRTAKFVSALFVSFLAGALLMATSDNAARAADDCVAGPKGQTPAGSHWYYRIEHATRRHCWYLSDEHEKLSQTAAPDASSAAKPLSPTIETMMQNSIADARAELPAQTRIDQPARVAAPAPAIAVDPTAASSLLSQRSLVATRWPESSGVSPSANPDPAPVSAPAPVNSAAAAPPPSPAPAPPASRATPSPAMSAVPLAAANAPSDKQSISIEMLLVIILGALPLIGVMASVIFRFGSTRRAGPRDTRIDRRAIWGSIDDDHAPPWASPHPRVSRRSADLDRERDTADDPSVRIEQMLAQLSKNAPA
jgi:hypothetical protein